jgi:hypothetical protein
MLFRFAAIPAAIFVSSALAQPTFAQTKPKNTVPTDRTEARQVVNQLIKEGRIMRSSDVRRGMIGVGRSVFQGTKIEEFKVVVLGNLQRVQGGADIILIKVLDGPVVKRQTGIIAGMSGSPVYINGKMIGAIALGWGFPKEPIGGVTPIESMIQSALPDKAAAPKAAAVAASTYKPRQPLKLAGRDITRVEISRDSKRFALRDNADSAYGATMTLKPATTLLQVGGFSEGSMPRLRKIFEPYGVEPIMGIPSRKTGVKANLAPGAAIGVQLVSGDMDQSAVGTVTFRWGNRVLAFGHPMFGQGAVSLPISTSYIHELFPSYQRSFKMASPIDAVGALQQDTQFAIGGTVGAKADTIPMTVSIREAAREISKTYRVRVMKDPLLTPQLIASVAQEAVETTVGATSDKMVRVGLDMQIDGAKPVKRRNLMYANQGVTSAALFDLGQTLSLTQSNEFARGSVRRVDLSISIEAKRETALIKSLTADRNRVKAGETVGVRVALEPTDKPGTTVTKTFQFQVPEDAPTGTLRLAASAAANFWPLQTRVGGAPPNPTNLPSLVDAWDKVGPMNELIVVASTPRQFLQVEQKKIVNAPPTFSKLMQSAPASNFGAYNETDVRREDTEYMIDGAQFLAIPVESTRHPETTGASPTPAPPTITAAPAAATTTTVVEIPQPSSGDSSSTASLTDFSSRVRSAVERDGSVDEMYTRLFEAKLFADHRKYLQSAASPRNGITPMQAAPGNVPGAKDPLVPTPTPAPGAKSGSGPNVTPTPEPTAVPTPTATPDSKSLARPAQSWVQTPADFLNGDFNKTQVSSAGRLQLAPSSKLVLKTADPFVWGVAGDSAGNTFLAMSNPARVVKVAPYGTSSTLWKNDDVAVTAIAMRGDALFVGSTPSGSVQRIDTKTGAARVIVPSAGSFVGALRFDDSGRLLIGGGGEESKLWRLDNPDVAGTPQVLATVPHNAIRAISTRGSDIFFGTGGEAVLYQLSADKKLTALYQVGDRASKNAGDVEILGVAAAPDGVYFGASNSGSLWRWTADGVEALYASPQTAVFALERAADGRLYMGTGDKGIVYEIRPGRSATTTQAARLLEPQPSQALALALAQGGDLLVGTGNAGSAYRIALGDTATGTYTSTVFDAKDVVRWGALRSQGRGAVIETRSGNTIDPDSTWSDWQAASGQGDEARVASPGARYLQLRARLQGNGQATWDEKAAQLTRVEVLYRTKNSAPQVGVAAPRGGEFWSGKQKVSWQGRDADSDTLRYKLSISSDDGATWQSVATDTPTDDSFDLDTSKYKDGTYRVKVEASDAARNPDDPQSDQDISQPFTIDNTAPEISGARMVSTPEGWRLTATISDATSPIAGAVWHPAREEKVEAKPLPTATPAPAKASIQPTTRRSARDSKRAAVSITATPGASVTTGSGAPVSAISAITAITSTLPITLTPADDASKKADDWSAVAAVDGLFDSRREEIFALIDKQDDGVKADAKTGLPRIELRAQDAAGNTVTVPVVIAQR